MATHHSVTVLCRELQAMSAANRTGSGTNAQLAKLVTKALADNQGLFERGSLRLHTWRPCQPVSI